MSDSTLPVKLDAARTALAECRTDFERLIAEVEAGNVAQAITLTNAYPETSWGQAALAAAVCVCFPKGRMKFIKAGGVEAGTAPHGQMICGFGVDAAKFRAAFGRIGVVR